MFTRNQVLMADSSGQTSPDVADYPMLEQAIRTGQLAQGTVTTANGRVAATAVPSVPAGGSGTVVAAVLVISSLEDVDNAVNAVQRQLLFATVLALGTSLLLGYMASYFIARRLKRIERSAEAIAGGDLSAKVPETVEDEIGQLADTFNVMADRLRSAFAQVEYERDRVEVLLNDLSEGVIGVSAEGKVTIANPAASILLDAPMAVGKTIEEALPADVAQLWRDSQQDADFDMVVFAHEDVTLEATTYPVAGDADFTSIVVLRDITAQARLERARRDLIANASHEFKTPLFSLAGSLELIDEGELSPEEQSEFLQIMRQQVDRLRTMAVSMLDLSRVEAGSFELNPEDVDLVAIGRSVLDEFQAQAQTKQVALSFEGEDGQTAWCDEQRLVQVLRALIDNAIKYSPRGQLGAADVTAGGAGGRRGRRRRRPGHLRQGAAARVRAVPSRARGARHDDRGGPGPLDRPRAHRDDGRQHHRGVAAGRRRAVHGAPAAHRGRAPPYPHDLLSAWPGSQALTRAVRLLNTPVGDR